MKTIMLSAMLVASFFLLGSSSTFAQTKKTTTAQDLTQMLKTTTIQDGLINVGGVVVNANNVTVQDLVTVQSVLNNAQIDVLRNSLNNNEVLKNITLNLTNLLRNAKILNQNQVIVGLLSGQRGIRFVTQNARSMK